MKNEQRLIEVLEPIILAIKAKHPNELHEGFFDKVMDHISGILSKANTKRYNRDLEALANSSPEGKKAVDSFMTFTDQLENDMAALRKMSKSGTL